MRRRVLRSNAFMVEKIVRVGSGDFMMQSSPIAWLTTMPVAQAPSTKALMAKIGSRPNAAPNASCRSFFVSIRSSQPRTQLVGVPVLPEDSSTVTPRVGSEPPQHRSSMRCRLTNDSLSVIWCPIPCAGPDVGVPAPPIVVAVGRNPPLCPARYVGSAMPGDAPAERFQSVDKQQPVQGLVADEHALHRVHRRHDGGPCEVSSVKLRLLDSVRNDRARRRSAGTEDSRPAHPGLVTPMIRNNRACGVGGDIDPTAACSSRAPSV